MKKDIHPKNFRPVIFQDMGNGSQYLIFSTVKTTKTGTYTDGKEYDVYEVDVSSSSHPFYTGETRIMDTAGRVDKFKARAAKVKKAA